jgi:hypothetical protein
MSQPLFGGQKRHYDRKEGSYKMSRCITYWQRTHKFGIHLPKTVAEALSLDKKNGNSLWYDTIQKVLKNVQVAFNFLSEDKATPIGCKQIPCHLIFDIKMDVSHKAHLLLGDTKLTLQAL